MKVVFQIPSLENIYAIRTIYNGYKNAFNDLGHDFIPYTSKDNMEEILKIIKPDIFIIALHNYYLKYLNLDLLNKYKKKGMIVFVSIPFWNSPLSKLRINENSSLSKNPYFISLIKDKKIGNVYFNNTEQEDERMKGFVKETGENHVTIPLACDKHICFPEYNEKFKADISYIGTYLPGKRRFIKEHVFPLKYKYMLKLYGQDWILKDRLLSYTQKVGQYFNISILKSIQKPKMELEDERKIYSSSVISLNIHEDYQKEYGGDCNERTFKIPACNGFEIADDVACIKKYFKEGEEIVIARNKNDWFDKIEYYIKNPEKRISIIKAGRKKVLKEHTYHNRVDQILRIYNEMVLLVKTISGSARCSSAKSPPR